MRGGGQKLQAPALGARLRIGGCSPDRQAMEMGSRYPRAQGSTYSRSLRNYQYAGPIFLVELHRIIYLRIFSNIILLVI